MSSLTMFLIMMIEFFNNVYIIIMIEFFDNVIMLVDDNNAISNILNLIHLLPC